MTTQKMVTISQIQDVLEVEGDGKISGKWLIWESMIGNATARKLDQARKIAGINGFIRVSRGKAPSVIGVLLEQVDMSTRAVAR